MRTWNCFNPTQIIFGEHVAQEFDYTRFGRRALIVCGARSARLCGALDEVRATLETQRISFTIFDRVENNPRVETCFLAGKLAREEQVDFIIGIGGGSPLDAAKAIAAFATNDCKTAESIYDSTVESALPVIAIGTTAGTGSEVTQYAVLTVQTASTKKTVKSPALFPKVALLDPRYTFTLPQRLTVATAVDAISHCIEGYCSVRASSYTDAIALRAMRMLANALRKLESGILDDEVREDLLQASTMAGLVIAQTGTGFAHVLGYMLTFFEGFQHGEANAQFLADFVAAMGIARPDKERAILHALGLSSIDEMRAWLRSLIPSRPHLTHEKVLQFAHISEMSASLKNSVYVIGSDEIYAFYKQYADQ